MTINEKKSVLAFYLSKYNKEALKALGYYDGITMALLDISEKITKNEGKVNNYVKQRRDEFDVFFDNGRAGYRNRKPTPKVYRMYEHWNEINFDDLTVIAHGILENDSDDKLSKLSGMDKIVCGLLPE